MQPEPQNLSAKSRERERAGVLAYFITFSCYGSHLPGQGGTVDDRLNAFGAPFFDADPRWLNYSRSVMVETPYRMDDQRRKIVLAAIRKKCTDRSWGLLAAHVRSTHVHVVLSANDTPESVMTALKAAASAGLNWAQLDPTTRRKRWARHGSTGIYGSAKKWPRWSIMFWRTRVTRWLRTRESDCVRGKIALTRSPRSRLFAVRRCFDSL